MSAVAEQVDNVADVISRSTAFQTETGAADATEALEFVSTVIETKPNLSRPRAYVCATKDMKRDRWGFVVAGKIPVIFERDVEAEYQRSEPDGNDVIHPEGPNPRAAYLAFTTWVDDVVEDMMLEFRNAGNLMVNDHEPTTPILRSEVDEQDGDGTGVDYLSQTIVFNFGAA